MLKTDGQTFWHKLKKPIIVLAPMADVTDAAFRRIIAKYGKPDVTWTEFVSADGLCLGGREKLIHDLKYTEAERPIVAQLFGSNVATMEEASALCTELGFDGIDINMGCPDKSIEKQGAGAAHMKNPKRAREIIQAAKRGVEKGVAKRLANGFDSTIIPVSVKTRIGYNKNELNTWLPEILAEKPAVVTVHARTRKEMSLVPARWEHVREAVGIRDRLAPDTLIFGNGDVLDLADARRKIAESGADGAMIGRGIFGNPWLWSEKPVASMPLSERLGVMVEHTKLFEELLGNVKNFAIMKKHYKAYVNGWDGAKELRVRLMEANSAAEIESIVSDYLSGALSTHT